MKTSERIKSILKRLLNEEIGKQKAWNENETKKGYPCYINRNEIIKEIKDFMKHENIEIDNDHIINGYYKEIE